MCDAPESVTLENEKNNFKDIPGKNWHGLAGQFFFPTGYLFDIYTIRSQRNRNCWIIGRLSGEVGVFSPR